MLMSEKKTFFIVFNLTLEKSIKTRHSARLALHSARCRRPSHFTKCVSYSPRPEKKFSMLKKTIFFSHPARDSNSHTKNRVVPTVRSARAIPARALPWPPRPRSRRRCRSPPPPAIPFFTLGPQLPAPNHVLFAIPVDDVTSDPCPPNDL